MIEGSILSLCAVILFRGIIHWLKNGRFALGDNKNKKIVIVGSYDECNRIDLLLQESNYKLNILGFITTGNNADVKGKYLGFTKQLLNIVRLYKVDEIIFCSKDLPANSIIEWMTQIDNSVVDFKIVPEETNFIIGSNSKNRRGDFYQLQINLNIIEEENIKYKRMLDISSSILFFILFPILALVIEKPSNFLRNIFNVFTGKKSWVGFTHTNQVNLPKIKSGIIHPSIACKNEENTNTKSIQELNFIYARDYSLFMDISLIAKSFKYLGRS